MNIFSYLCYYLQCGGCRPKYMFSKSTSTTNLDIFDIPLSFHSFTTAV